MDKELDSRTEEFTDIPLDGLSDETIFFLLKDYIERNMSPASLSKFNEVLMHDEDLVEAVTAAVFNEAMVQIVERHVKEGLAPIPPFNI